MTTFIQARLAELAPDNKPENEVVMGPRVVRNELTGEMISIAERRAGAISGARRPTCLIISTERGFTRLWHYPANWAELSDAELVELSERRIVLSQSA